MKTRIRSSVVWLMVGLTAFLSAQGCPPAAPPDGNQTTYTQADLSDGETAAIDSGLGSVESLTAGMGTTQAGTDVEVLTAKMLPDALSAGTCPVVTANAGGGGSLEFALTVDFGDGCEPAFLPGVECSGSASGSISQSNQSVALNFENLVVDGNELDGTADLSFTLVASTIGLTGEWDLFWNDGVETISTSGDGDFTFDGASNTVLISEFNGTVEDGQSTYTLVMDAVATSYATYASFIPYDGEMTLRGPNIRELVIRFDASSPTTGEVEVSIDGSPFFTVNLFTLLEDEIG